MLVVTCCCAARAQTERFSLLHDPLPDLQDYLEQADAPSTFRERFESAFDRRSGEVFADRLHPLTIRSRSLQSRDNSWLWDTERNDRAAQTALLRSAEYSLRDAFLALPLMDWLILRRDLLRDFLVDTVDAVEEETVSPLDPTYHPSERLWWQSLADNRQLRFGLRPFRTNPYAYLSWRISDAERRLLLGHVRYYYREFADHRFELAFSVPLPRGVTVDMGTTYQFGQHEPESRFVCKVSKPLKHGGVVHVALETREQTTLLAGISMPW